MLRNTLSLSLAFLIVAIVLSPAPRAWGQEEPKIRLGDTDVMFKGTDSHLQAALDYNLDRAMDNDIWASLFIKLPTEAEAQSHQSRIDEVTDSWRVGLSVRKGFDFDRPPRESGEKPSFHWILYTAGLVEWGFQEYRWNPDGGSADRDVFRHSLAARLKLSAYIRAGQLWAPSVTIRYSLDWKEEEKIGIVIPGTGGLPSTVVDRRMDGPFAEPALTFRAYVYTDGIYRFGERDDPKGHIALGPSIGYTFAGDRGSHGDPFNRKEVLRLELWLYYLPVSKTIDLRIGVSPFLDLHTRGAPEDEDHYELGALLQVRVGAPIYEY